MKTFFNILQTLVNRKLKSYPDEPFLFFSTSNIDQEYYNENIYISFFINNIYYKEKKLLYEDYHYRIANAKFLALNEYLNNIFYTKEIKETIFNIFSKAQKCYHAFSRFSHIYKFKKYKVVVENDLSLNPLNPNHRNTFILIENNSKFLFSLNDLISIIETAICNSPNFFADPIWPENPYNKQKLKPSTLYNIYFKLKESGRLISSLFHFFFLEHFQLSNFVEQYEAFIRENSIKKFIFNSPYTTLYIPTLKMLKNNKYTKLLKIDDEFPKDKLVDIFRPFLYYYYIYNYDIKGTSKIYSYKIFLHQKLKKFYQYNKLFGRKSYSVNKNFNSKTKSLSCFNTNHIGFYKIPVTTIETYDSDFAFFDRNTRINILLENRIFSDINNNNNNFIYNLFHNSDEEDEEEQFHNDDDSDDDSDDGQLTILQPSENRNFQTGFQYNNNNTYDNVQIDTFISSEIQTYQHVSRSNSNDDNSNSFILSYSNTSTNSRDNMDIFYYENNDNDSVS
jgi:hypothetical protein